MFNWFRKKTPKTPDHDQPLPQLMASLLADAIRNNGDDPFQPGDITATANAVSIPDHDIIITCDVVNERRHTGAMVMALSFSINIQGEDTFYEELAALGQTHYDTIAYGVNAFRDGFWEGFTRSFTGHHHPELSLHNREGHDYHLISSQLQVQGVFRHDHSLEQDRFLKILFPALEQLFTALDEAPDYIFEHYYCVKIYLSRQSGDDFIGECRFDNQDWEAGLQQLVWQDYDQWPPSNDFLAKKQFIFIRRCGN